MIGAFAVRWPVRFKKAPHAREIAAVLGRQAGLVGVLALSACGTLATAPPPSFDLGGEWLLDAAASDPPPDVAAIRRREDRDLARGRAVATGASAAFVLEDFRVLTATRLRIAQDGDSMGVTYGEHAYRDVSWGVRERDLWTVHAGWKDGALVVRSSRGETSAVEIYTLTPDGALRVSVSVRVGDDKVDAARVYRRAAAARQKPSR